MKILFVYQYCLLGGVTTQLVNRLAGLRDEWEVHFLFLGEYGGKVSFKDYPHVYIFNNPRDFKMLIEAQHYEIISVIDTNQIYDWLRQCQFEGLLINEVHTTTANLNKLQFLKQEKAIHLIVTPSQYMKKMIQDTYGFRGSIPVEVIPNCIDSKLFMPLEKPQTSSSPTLLWVGKLDDHKKWYEFMEIAWKLEYEYNLKHLQYIVVGGVTANQEVIDRFITQLVEDQLAHKVKWYSAIDYQHMHKIYDEVYQSGGVYVSTTTNESFGMTVLEAMCMQLPIVVPKVGALVELCQPYGAHILYTPQNLDEACECIIKQIGTEPMYDLTAYSTQGVCTQFKDILTQYMKKLKG